MKISYDKLVELLKSQKSATAVTILAETNPAMRKTNNPFAAATKLSSVNGMISWLYETAVNKQRLREGNEPDFEAQPRAWGARVKGTPLVVHKDKVYLELKVQKSLEHQYKLGDKIISHDEIKEFLKPIAPQPQQALVKEVVLRDYDLKNIRSIKLNGILYEVAE